MTNNLRPGERLDDLQLGGLELIQNPSKFCFGVDAGLIWEPGMESSRFYLQERRKESILQGLRYRLRLQKWQDAVLHITIWKTELAL